MMMALGLYIVSAGRRSCPGPRGHIRARGQVACGNRGGSLGFAIRPSTNGRVTAQNALTGNRRSRKLEKIIIQKWLYVCGLVYSQKVVSANVHTACTAPCRDNLKAARHIQDRHHHVLRNAAGICFERVKRCDSFEYLVSVVTTPPMPSLFPIMNL